MKKRILQLSNYYPPEIGGIEKTAQDISDSVKRDYDVRVLCFTHDKKSRTDTVDGVKVIRCGTVVKVASQQLAVRMVSEVKKQLREYDPDIVIVHVPNPFLEWILLRYIKKSYKLIVYWHSDIVKQKLGNVLLSGLTDRLLKRAGVIVATSPNYIEGSVFLRKYRKKCVVIPSCIDADRLQLSDRAKRLSEEIRQNNRDKHVCVCVGRQVPYKGFEYAIEAVKQLDDSFVLYMLGRSGESTKKLKEAASGSSRIVFLGEVDDDTLHAYLDACDIFCFPSVTKNEAFGLALAEGMLYGKPAVTFTIPGSGVNFVSINGETGIEVENSDVNAYARALRLLADNRELREKYGEAARERVTKLFLKERFGKKIVSLVRKVDVMQTDTAGARYAIDGIFLCKNVTGIQRYAIEITKELDKIVEPGLVELVVPVRCNESLPLKNIRTVRYGNKSNRIWEQIDLPVYLRKKNVQGIFFENTVPLLYRKGIVTVHDIILKTRPEMFRSTLKGRMTVLWRKFMYAAIMRSGMKIVTVSEFSKKEILKNYRIDPGRVTVIYSAWQHIALVEADDSVFEDKRIRPGEYNFAMASMMPNKNFTWIARAAQNNPDEVFVIAGGGKIKDVIDANCKTLSNLIYLGYVSDGVAKALMSKCKRFLFPTFYEGFGLPPLEALACGAGEIVLSDIECLREIYGDSAVYVDPGDYGVKLEMLKPQVKRDNEVLNKYEWGSSAKRLRALL